ncbi:MAG: LrgB family protein [Bdellovibrionales bacterium]
MTDILSDPLVSLFITLLAFYGFGHIQKRFGGHSMLNPVVWAIIVCVCFIQLVGISYDEYMQGAGIIHFLLGPVTVALAVPLYRLLGMIKKDARALLITVFCAALISAFSAYAVMVFMDAHQDMQLAITSKSVTAPIAIEIANKIGTPESLAVLFVFATNIPWLLLTGFVFKAMRMKDDDLSHQAQGLALGTVCHGLGVARAFQISEICGTYSVIGMSIMGIISGVVLPILIIMFVL